MGGDLRGRMLRGMLWKEWRAHGAVIIRWTLVPFFAVTVLQVLNRPYWVGIASALAAVFLTHRIAGGDNWEGAEEFSFALPPTRRMIFWTRYFMCAVPFFTVLFWNMACLRWNIPQAIWGLFVDSGFTSPFRSVTHETLFVLASIFIPIAVFHISFAGSIIVANRNKLMLMRLISPGIVFGLFVLGLFMDSWFLPREPLTNDFDPKFLVFTWVLPLLVALPVFFVIAHRFASKEGYAGGVLASSVRTGVIIAAIFILIILSMLMLKQVSYEDSIHPPANKAIQITEEHSGTNASNDETAPLESEDGSDTEGDE